ncbi:uncharacterized protein UV8b_02244 [Ustilaginoidea virens]|uniref:Rad21/Rec8-like protein N-terminal domain-containing protein n=2 Tax=Ustilaginoidea virens TaxID=1159556 RepID=A0A8E5MF44_USTVR|nr:uncharacterized protein UV8b_02244 [Ustilaginoidea virens]QUC18003.1 hypothetical protein UV8b_02244 [Ustilaginoidea virens]
MFYSHEVLSNSQYGVSTIWLVATVGKGNQRRLNRKKIQEVNVPKACEKIIDPGAPLALRLQGNLLYGVSRVFAQQCSYVLSDAAKTQSDMMTFFRSMNTSEVDPKAGKTKRHHIMVQDDPRFDPMAPLPRLEELVVDSTTLKSMATQETNTVLSQLSPLTNSIVRSGSAKRKSSHISLDLPPSSHSIGSYRLPVDFYHTSSPFNKTLPGTGSIEGYRPFTDDELEPLCDVGLDFDANGNLINVVDEEPALPPLPQVGVGSLRMIEGKTPIVDRSPGTVDFPEEGENAYGFGEAAEAGPLAVLAAAGEPPNTDALLPTTEERKERRRPPSPRRGTRRRHARVMFDEVIRVSREEFRGWTENYPLHMEAARKRGKRTTAAQSQKNALALMYTNGLSNVGLFGKHFGAEHPLTAQFAGTALKAHLLGLRVDEVEDIDPKRGKRRRYAESSAVGREAPRRVRPRLDIGEEELGRGPPAAHMDETSFGDDTAVELGMEAEAALEERNSSSLMPWSRQGSAVPGSASRAPGSAQKPLPARSPLHSRGSVAGSIERFSDPAEEAFEAAGFGSQPSSLRLRSDLGGPATPIGHSTQGSATGLDASSQYFLDYVTEQAVEREHVHSQGGRLTRWVDFEEIAHPERHSKSVATQAFLHILSLATKSILQVEQDGQEANIPFGTIRVGLRA